MNEHPLSVVILAAGKGTRMHSTLPKVLHNVAGKPMVKHVIDTAHQLGAENIHLIYGYCGDLMRARLADEKVNWVFQAEQLGTGHAMQQAAPFLRDNENIIMLYGDAPLITKETLTRLIAAKPEGGIALLTVTLDNPTGYGRIIRENGRVVAIVEQKDANAEQLNIHEVNTGVMVLDGVHLKKWLAQLDNNNAQGEYYMTDVIALANRDGCSVIAVQAADYMEVEGANNRLQLVALERYFQRKQAERLLLAGVMLLDPERFDLRGTLEHGKEVEIDTNVIIEGHVRLGDRVKIGTGCVLKNVVIGDDVEVKPYSILEDSVIGEKAAIGPFSRLRPEPWQSEQGVLIIFPVPWHRLHVREVIMLPNIVRCMTCSCPEPLHAEQVSALEPFAAPEPPQVGQFSSRGMESSTSLPNAASSNEISRS